MSNRKRSQESQESLDSDGDNESLDRSSATPPSRKRPRVSESPTSEVPEGSSSSDAEDAANRGLRSVTVGLNQNEDELDELATQLIQEKYSFGSDEPNVPSEHGILERVECYNFMCHNQFQVELGPLINFVVGKNGSGKSAVLTAITLCLGGKASATNRGQSLKSFIKEGKESATIVVRIKNQGDGAYLPSDLGKSIIVERHFNRSGSSSFKIKADNGRIFSTKRAELDAVIDHFTLQFDNPMNVLSQDMARQFLSSSSPAEKYKFFVKGVQLEQLDQDYRLIEESGDLIEERLGNTAEDIALLESRHEAAQKKLELSNHHEGLRDRIRILRGQHAWAQVEEQERIEESLIAEVSELDNKLIEVEADIERCDAAIRETEAENETAAKYAREASTKVDDAQNGRNELQAKHDEKMHERQDLQADQRRVRDSVMETQTRVAELQQKIDEENQRLAALHGGGYSQKQEEFEQAKQDVVELQRQIKEHDQDADRMNNDVKKAEDQEFAARSPVSQAKDDYEEAEALLQNLSKEGGSRRSGLPDKMPVLLRAIQQDHSFTEKPIGPIANFVTLLKPEWSSIIESSFGATLNGFIVTSKRDQSVLSGIMQRVNCQVPIFIGSGGRIDTSQHEPDQQFDTVLRVLQIDNELVRRQLIITQNIEQNLLIEDLERASDVLFGGERPKNAKRCYSISPSDRRRGQLLSYSRNGEPSQTPVAVYNGNPRMKSDRDSQIRVQRDAVANLRRVLHSREEERRSAQSHLNRCRQARERWQRKKNDLQVESQRRDDRVEELEEALQKEGGQEGELEILQASLRDTKEEHRICEGSLRDAKEQVEEAMQVLRGVRQEMNTKDAEIAKLKEELRVAESEQHMITDKRRKRIGEKNTAVDLLEHTNQRKARMVQRRDAAKDIVQEHIRMASLVSERVQIDPGETPDSVDKKLDRLQEDISRYNQRVGGTREEIREEAQKAHNNWKRATKQVREFNRLLDLIKAALVHRKHRWKIFRSHISSRAKAQFTYLLSERSFRGRLLADHESRTLDLQVEPDITKDSSEGRGARTLSGGEKSFSQVCLLLALWEAMGSPIRCLDEFDVYMDHINRKMAIDMLMYAARRSIGRQFILITPGSRAEISLAPDVMVKELAEPERGQARLSFRR